MIRRTLLAATILLLAAACGPTPTEAPRAHSADALRDDAPPPPPPSTTQPAADTTQRGGGGTIGSGT